MDYIFYGVIAAVVILFLIILATGCKGISGYGIYYLGIA